MDKALNSRRLKVLAYHKIKDKSCFEDQIRYLQKNYRFISPRELMTEFKETSQCKGDNMLLTFDDGDKSIFDNALPILKKYRVPAIIFVITDLIDTDKPFWWDEIEYYLGKEIGNKKVWEVKSWPNKVRETYLEKLRASSKKERFKYPQLTIRELKEMQRAGITIANHSHNHPMFDQCGIDEIRKELQQSTNKLKELNFTPNIFAYPNGNSSENSEMILKEFGINMAFLFDHKINKEDINPLRISRLIVNDSTPLWKFKFILSGLHSKILPFTKFIGKLTR